MLTVLFFTHDEKSVFNGIVKARIVLTLAEDLKSYDSVAERVVMDTSGKELQVNTRHRGAQYTDGRGVSQKPAAAVAKRNGGS